MWKVNEEEREFLSNNFENSESLIRSVNRDDLLLALNSLILRKGFDDTQDNLNEFGLEAQRITDNIIDNN